MKKEDIKYGFWTKEEEEFPQMLHAVITNVCNLECIHCAYKVVKRRSDYKPSFLEWDIFTRVADEVASHKDAILRFTCDGEPLLHPRILDMVEYAKNHNLRPVTINTNGLLLDRRMIDNLLDREIDVIEVSINAHSKEGYYKLRKSNDYDEIVARTHYLIKARDSRPNCATKVMVSIINQREVESEVADFIKYWTPLVDKVIIRTYTSYRGMVDKTKELFDEEAERYPCFVLWRRITLNSEGKLRFCFNDWCNQSVMVDLKDGISIEEVWRGKEYQRLRQLHLERRFREIPYCADCTTWYLLKWDYDYGQAIKEVME